MLRLIKPVPVFSLIVVLGVALHWNIWELDIMGIHAWRQTQTMTVVENFAFEDMNILNPRINSRGADDGIFRAEFPLMQWLFAWAYKWLGADLFYARLLTFIISLCSAAGFYYLLRSYKLAKNLSVLATWCWTWSPLLFYYSVNPLPDNLALCFAVWSLVFLKRYQQNASLKHLSSFAVFLGLATAVKLPFVVFGAGLLPVFIKHYHLRKKTAITMEMVLVLIGIGPALSWYAWVIPQWENDALIGGIGAEQSFDWLGALRNGWGMLHAQLPELFINYGSVLFFLAGLVVLFRSKDMLRKYGVEIAISIGVTGFYIYEINMIGLAHDYYMFPFVPLIFLIVAAGLRSILCQHRIWLRNLAFAALLILPVTAYLRSYTRWKPMGNEKPLLAHKSELRNLTPPDELVVVGNDASTHIYLYHLGKKGWTFEQNWLTEETLRDHINKGAKFLYSNTEFVVNDSSINKHLEDPIFEKDGLAVFPLKMPTDS